MLIRSIIGILGCLVTGMSLATLIISNLYVTQFQQIGIIEGVLIGLILIVAATFLVPQGRWARFYYLVIYMIMFGSLMLTEMNPQANQSTAKTGVPKE